MTAEMNKKLEEHKQELIRRIEENLREIEDMTVEEMFYFESDLETQAVVISASEGLGLILEQIPFLLDCSACRKHYGGCFVEQEDETLEYCKDRWIRYLEDKE